MSLSKETRKQSFKKTQDELGTRQLQVLEQIQKHGPITRRELSLALELPINCITGRVKELLQRNLITEDGIICDQVTNRRVTTLIESAS